MWFDFINTSLFFRFYKAACHIWKGGGNDNNDGGGGGGDLWLSIYIHIIWMKNSAFWKPEPIVKFLIK